MPPASRERAEGGEDSDLCLICQKPPLQCGCDDYPEKPDTDYCCYCGKDRYDWSDLGCSACDARHPNFGVIP